MHMETIVLMVVFALLFLMGGALPANHDVKFFR